MSLERSLSEESSILVRSNSDSTLRLTLSSASFSALVRERKIEIEIVGDGLEVREWIRERECVRKKRRQFVCGAKGSMCVCVCE